MHGDLHVPRQAEPCAEARIGDTGHQVHATPPEEAERLLLTSFEDHQVVVAAAIPIVLPVLERVVQLTTVRLLEGAKVLALGNGGSAAQAQHFVAEIAGRFQVDRRAWPAVALSADSVALTAIANDDGFERVFARQVEALARPGDVVVVISTSGTSPNVVEAARRAGEIGCHVVGLTGRSGGSLADVTDLLVCVPSDDVARIQEVHTICLHAWAGEVERVLTATAS